ncbi:hypothetical protein [Waddlia chondrophila]|uniref:Uncharacterized protein n=1 Tax=Waddlia chondrophila (strain ATCC VR-1470 / WSU 86-1044) TaxID=716544 RepID=D6YX15_WADCW|nr:hypothetical protein [Waddlia chondrophila]ADI39321.1 hypothetical protein wcw_p0010 [Waddlia chondrophila WSU 86-1044]
MNRTNKNRISKLESGITEVGRHKSALVIYDPNVDYEKDLAKIDADVVLALPDNGRKDLKNGVVIGSCVVSYC